MVDEIGMHICFLQGKLNAFSELSSTMNKSAFGGPNSEGSAVQMSVNFIKQEIAFLTKLLETYQQKE